MQKEAMCLMWYECEICKVKELLWNSRPRVTPYMIACLTDKCSGFMVHIDWEKDEYAPDHMPQIGDRIFTDWTRQMAQDDIKKRIELFWDDKDFPMSEHYRTKEEALKILMSEWKFGCPCTITV